MLAEMQETMGVTPQGLASRPPVMDEDLPYLSGFRALSRCRVQGQYGPRAITMVDIQAYLLLTHEEGVEERLKFLRIVQDMDGVYLDHAANQAKPTT